jgi:ABC-type uncharacterized transport system permease subunit
MKILSFLKGRKGQLMLAAILSAVAGGLAGEMSWQTVILTSIGAIMAGITGIAIEDAGTKAAGKVPGTK